MFLYCERKKWQWPDTPTIQKILDTRRFLKHGRVPLRLSLVLWDKKFATENHDLPLHAQKFSTPEINETIKGSPAKSFGTVTQKDFRQNCDTPIIQKENDTWPFLKHRRVPLRYFWNWETKKFKRKSWCTPIMFKIFWYPKLVKHKRVLPRKVLVLGDKKNRQNRDTSFIQKKLITERFWNTEGFPYEYFLYCETKKNSSENRDIPLKCLKVFENRN